MNTTSTAQVAPTKERIRPKASGLLTKPIAAPKVPPTKAADASRKPPREPAKRARRSSPDAWASSDRTLSRQGLAKVARDARLSLVKLVQITLTSCNYLGFPAIPTEFCENLNEK